MSLHDERVHPRRQKASVGLLGGADDRLASHVEAGVDDGRAPRLPGEGLEQSVIPAVTGFVDRLNPSGVVDVRDGGYRRSSELESVEAGPAAGPILWQALLVAHRCHEQHVGALLTGVHLEPLIDTFSKHRRREGSERLAELDLQVHHRLHLLASRVTQNAPRAQRSRSKLHATLKPPDDLS